jgi:hypothetical protein
MNTNESDQVPSAFRELWDAAQRVINPPQKERHAGLYALPVSLERATDLIEKNPAYQQFVQAAPWHPKPSAWRLSEALRRAGFYHSVQKGGDPRAIWARLAAQLTPRLARERTLLLLDGCWFPLDRFRIGGMSVERFSAGELQNLGPQPDIASAFFPAEALDPDWYTHVWFLTEEHERHIKPTSLSVRLGYDALRQFWQPLLALALYRTDYFALPIVLESEPGWRLERVQWSEPASNIVEDNDGESIEVPRTDYCVDQKEQPRFAAFTRFFDDAIKNASEFRMFRLAGRRYLRAMEIAGPYTSGGDDYEDALLQYVFALEALLSGGDHEAIADKIATRAAWLVGTSDTVRNDTFKTIKKLYAARSSIVHGNEKVRRKTHSRELEEIRDLMRRVLLGLMALRRSTTSDAECLGLLNTAAFDRGSQSQIAAATESVWTLVDPVIPWPGESWGPKYDRPAFTG